MPDLYYQPSMAAGEIGPELYGRVDQELFYIGMRTCRNMIIRQYGGASNRPGKKIIAECKDQTRRTRLIPFTFNELQTYALEFGHQYMRVIKDGGEVLEAATVCNITGITITTDVLITAANSFANGDDVYLTGILGTVELNGRAFRVSDRTGANFKLKDYLGNYITDTGLTAYVSGGTATRIYTLATPWTEDDLLDLDDNACLNYAQNNNVLTVVHQDYYPRDITRTNHDAWTLAQFANTEGPFKDINATATTIVSDAETGNVTLTASAALFAATWVGEMIYIEQEPTDATIAWEPGEAITSGNVRRAGAHYYEATNSATSGTVRPDWIEGTFSDGAVTWLYLHSGFGIVRVTAYTDSTHVDADVIKRLPANTTTTATDIWARAAWSTAEGYPAACAYHKGRFIFGGTVNRPNVMNFSGTGLRTFFGQNNPILDDDSFSLPLNTTGSNAIRHLVPFAELISLTAASEHLINGTDDSLLATELPFNKVQGYTGASRVPPIIINNTAIMVQDMGSVVRSLQYQLDTDSFGGIDLTARSPHLFRGRKIIDWAYQRQPLSVVWTIMSDGALLGFTFMEEQKVYAWHRHDSGDAEYESVCCIREGDETAAYFVVKRIINGVTRRFIERFASRYFTEVRDAYFVDCGLTYDGRNTGTTTMTISGGTLWNETESLTITASAGTFLTTDIGNQLAFWAYDTVNKVNIRYALTITAYTSGTVVTGVPTKTLPSAYWAVAFTDWEMARKIMRPLDHLNGEAVSVLADGNVVTGHTVANGHITLAQAAAVVHVGLPYVADLETLDMSSPPGSKGGSLTAQPVVIPRVFLSVQESRSVFVSTSGLNSDDSLTDQHGKPIFETKQRTPAMGYDEAIPAETGIFEANCNTTWSRQGRVAVRQKAPLPITINCIIPEATIGKS